jgi:exodeoxyribonuclease VII small subunit
MSQVRDSLSTVVKEPDTARNRHFYGILGRDWLLQASAATIICTPCEAKLAKEPIFPKDIAGLSFEDALKELEGIVQQLERGQVKLDEAISAYERGALLKKHCEQKLAEAKMKVEKIVFSADGSVGSQPADLG